MSRPMQFAFSSHGVIEFVIHFPYTDFRKVFDSSGSVTIDVELSNRPKGRGGSDETDQIEVWFYPFRKIDGAYNGSTRCFHHRGHSHRRMGDHGTVISFQ